jgi:hypothetical protein
MKGILTRYLADDHDRLDGLLRRALRTPGSIDPGPYAEFRAGLLHHISMEEKVMLPAVARLQGGRQAEVAARLRLDHGAIVALMVPSPTPSTVATLLYILGVHNELEEKDGGVYELVDTLAGPEAEALLRQLRETPPVPVLPHNDRPGIIDATRRAVARAGYEFKETDTFPA